MHSYTNWAVDNNDDSIIIIIIIMSIQHVILV